MCFVSCLKVFCWLIGAVAAEYDIAYNSCLNETQKLCTFRIVNGVLLSVMSGTGLLMCIWIIYNIVFCVIRLQGTQNVFVLNVLFHDTLVGVLGVIRGLGIIDDVFVGVESDGDENFFCLIFPIVGHLIWNNPLMVLMPLTIDRFLAIIAPFLHKNWMSHKIMFTIIGLWWIPATFSSLYRLMKFHMGHIAVRYQPEYHRCTIENLEIGRIESFVFYFIPMLTLVVLYTIMVVHIIRSKTRCRKLLLTSLSICTVAVLIGIPQTLLYVKVRMSYKVAQFFTVTLFYITPLSDSIIYYCSNPRVQEKLPDTKLARTARRFSEGISNLSNNVKNSFNMPSFSEERSRDVSTPSEGSCAGRLDSKSRYSRPSNMQRYHGNNSNRNHLN
ncbi:hypothetical protein ACHWQZ_G013283 [Mnemiopsis leidyi]